ncbi:secretory phospholipase A2 receptor-like [Mercenaria mercenaria]|uniref:secretory phospholipase A2 receptor-like n=1 Tax=Mercenaria mercenaria TaxID=6596 RepID=UPI00234EE7FA|nr:secretory phospholipase A2 receptor-like [Mercenaria mercenaria]
MNWCRLMDGQLVELKSQAFNTLLARMIAVKNTGKYWIGLTNMENERVFRWMTTKETVNPMDPRMSFFKPGQQLSGQPKHCVHTDEKGEWTVESCKAQFWFICQKNNRIKGSSKKVRTRL